MFYHSREFCSELCDDNPIKNPIRCFFYSAVRACWFSRNERLETFFVGIEEIF
uniref:Uncharacterized protein n=1 Tax=uncultured marine virus TaxID=186617 RepID=A0A0F7L542_9VIRU|nr:hypothetical protein [uncultured marine virus]